MDDHSARFDDLAAQQAATQHDLAIRLVEAALFASAEPVTPRALLALLAPLDQTDVEAIVARVAARHEGSGLCVQAVAGGWQFRTAPDLAPFLTQVQKRPRRLPRATMETLAIIAYHQPCTRTEIEEIRGVSLGQNVLETLIEAELVMPCGRKEVPGRPTLWGTTPGFLERFGLRSLRDLPKREELVAELPGVVAPTPELDLAKDDAAA